MGAAFRLASTLAALRRLWGYVTRYPVRLLCAVITFAAAGATLLALGGGVRRLVDVGLHGSLQGLNATALNLAALVLVYGASGLARAYLSGFLSERVTSDLRNELFSRLLTHNPEFLDEDGAALIWSRASADLEVVGGMLSACVTATRSLIVIVGGVVAMLATSLFLTFFVVALATGVVAAVASFGPRVKRLSDLFHERSAQTNAFALEALEAATLISTLNLQATWTERFGNALRRDCAVADRRNLVQGTGVAVGIWLAFGFLVLLGWTVGFQMLRGTMTEGRASAFLFFALAIAASGASLSDLSGQLQRGVSGLQRLFALLDQPIKVAPPSKPRRVPTIGAAAVAFESVAFSYPSRPASLALSSFSWSFEPGATTAIVGPSGAGKSTLFALLLRLYDPISGRVVLNGVDIRAADASQVRNFVGVVPQDTRLLTGTVADNIRLGREGAPRNSIVAAAEAADAMDFIEGLPRGLDTPVGPGGTQLSGGQRQRIAIARAVLRDPPILLLDEATNALDARSEASIQAAITRMSAGRTTLVIAHKLATVRRAQAILVMDHGVLTDWGTHGELVGRDGLYARLSALQLH